MSKSAPIVFAAIFRSEGAGGANPTERVDHFTAGCCQGLEPEAYATSMLMEDGEWLDDVVEEQADVSSAPAVIERALDYMESMSSHGMSEVEVDLHNDLSRLLASYKALGLPAA